MRREFEQFARERTQQNRMASMATGGTVVSVNSRANTLQWGGVKGTQDAPISHPYLGPTSWFRVCPERSTKVVVGYRGENLSSYVAAYTAETIEGNTTKSLIEATEAGKFYYRILKEGEMHAISTGMAETMWLQNGNLLLRGGAVRVHLDNENLECEITAPSHRQATLGSRSQQYGNESRFGAVIRPSPLDTTQRIAVKHEGEWAKERTSHLKQGDIVSVDHREGLVVEDNGTVAQVNGAALRARLKWGTVQGDFVSCSVDVNGNVNVRVPQCDDGLVVETLTDLSMNVGKSLKYTVTEDWLAQADNIDFDANTIQLAGNLKLATENFGTTLQAASGLTPPKSATAGAIFPSVVAIVEYLQTLAGGYNAALTTKTGAG